MLTQMTAQHKLS